MDLDIIFDLLKADPSFTHFHTDGQMVTLEDYLEIRPHMRYSKEENETKKDGKKRKEESVMKFYHFRSLLENYGHSNKISLGPWYTQPDSFLISGESMVYIRVN